MTTGEVRGEARRATWLELFFDLVVVAAIAQLAHRLHDRPGAGDIALFVLLYLAVWIAWCSFTLYANVAGEKTGRRAMLLAMLGIAVMAAAVPEATGPRTWVFVIAYLVVRVLAIRVWAGTGRALFSFPSVQTGLGLMPWIVSLFVPPPWRYGLWALGLAIDILLPVVGRLASVENIPGFVQRWMERENGGGPPVERPKRREVRRVLVDEALPDRAHLAERLGLFLIIVLGEAVLQAVRAAGGVTWSGWLVAVAVGGFGLLVGLFWPMFFRNGYFASEGRMPLPLWLLLPLHFLTALGITAIAVGLGALIEHPHDAPSAGMRWLLCGGLLAYNLSAVVGGAIGGMAGYWRFGLVPGVLAPLLLGVFGGAVPAAVLIWLLAAMAAWPVVFGGWWQRRHPAATVPAAAPVGTA